MGTGKFTIIPSVNLYILGLSQAISDKEFIIKWGKYCTRNNVITDGNFIGSIDNGNQGLIIGHNYGESIDDTIKYACGIYMRGSSIFLHFSFWGGSVTCRNISMTTI